jgi:hypothetical protein
MIEALILALWRGYVRHIRIDKESMAASFIHCQKEFHQAELALRQGRSLHV